MVCVSVFQAVAQIFGQPSAVPGTITPKAVKEKKPKIKYNIHNGIAYLKTGLVVKGKFIYTEFKGDVPVYYFSEENVGGRKSVALSMIDRLVLQGAEANLVKGDSTEFVWIDKFKDLYRKIKIGSIELYDNSRIVDEKYEYLPDYVMVAGRKDHDFKFIKQVADLAPLMTDRPYFMESLRATGRAESRDLRLVFYLVDLFNDPAPIQLMRWDDMQILTKDSTTLTGKGYIQPIDIRNEYVSSSNAYVHFYDGTDFRLFSQTDIRSISVQQMPYKEGYYNTTGKYFFGKPWTYNNTNYLVTKRLLTSNNYYYRYRQTDNQDITIMKEDIRGYVKPINDVELRQLYLTEMAINNTNTPNNGATGQE